MKKVTKLVLGIIALTTSINVNAQTYILQQGIDVDLNFKPGVSQILSNPAFWSMNVNCKMLIESPQALMKATAIKKGAKVDGESLKQGQTKEMLINNNQTLQIRADGRAKIELTNFSNATVTAKCKV